MATRFAVKTGNWSDTTLWDNGALPVSGDVIYPNGFTVTIDQDINIASLNNNVSNVYLPNMPIPAMTSNTTPNGVAFATQNTLNAYLAFDQNSVTQWDSLIGNNGTIGYTFTSTKYIVRYYFRSQSGQQPTAWSFQGSNDNFATAGVILHSVTGGDGTSYVSPLFTNTIGYTSYRLVVTACSGSNTCKINQFDMTESSSTSYGATTGGSFAVPSTLSGSRNIVQSGAGIISNNLATVVSIAATVGNTVNFNVTSGGFILNQQNHTAINTDLKIIDITGTCTINFNGDLWGSQYSVTNIRNSLGTIYINSFAIVNINGNIYSPRGTTQPTLFNAMIHLASSGAVLNINGNLIASDYSNSTYIVYASVASSITNITGTLTSNIGLCYYSVVGSVLNIPTGTVTVTNLNSSPAIFMSSTASLLTLNSPIINKDNANAVLASRIRFYSTGNPYWIVQNNLNQDITLAYGSATGAYPAEADVRFGVNYAASPTRTGTCRVPLPQYVSQGVLVDATVGTLLMTPADFWGVSTGTLSTAGSVGKLMVDNIDTTVSSRASQTSVNTLTTDVNNIPADVVTELGTSTDPIAVRLQNASTVQTTGDQIAAF